MTLLRVLIRRRGLETVFYEGFTDQAAFCQRAETLGAFEKYRPEGNRPLDQSCRQRHGDADDQNVTVYYENNRKDSISTLPGNASAEFPGNAKADMWCVNTKAN